MHINTLAFEKRKKKKKPCPIKGQKFEHWVCLEISLVIYVSNQFIQHFIELYVHEEPNLLIELQIS